MPCDRKNWIELPKDQAGSFCVIGEHLWRGTRDHMVESKDADGKANPGTAPALPLSHGISLSILQPLAAEYQLKRPSLGEKGGFKPTHDLHALYENLKSDTQAKIAEPGTAVAGTDLPAFLKAHRYDFVKWRYPLESDSLTANPFEFDKALVALMGAFLSRHPLFLRSLLDT